MRFEAELAFLSTADGGRQTPVLLGYRPDAWFGATDAEVTVRIPNGLQDYGITVEQGSRFEVQEGSQVVARGLVTRMLGSEESAA